MLLDYNNYFQPLFNLNIFFLGIEYTIGIMRTLEKRFSFSSTKVNTLLSIMDFTSCALVLFVGFAGGKFHKPRMLGTLMFAMVIADIFFLAGPYFYFGAMQLQEFQYNSTRNVTVETHSPICGDSHTRTLNGDINCDNEEDEISLVDEGWL